MLIFAPVAMAVLGYFAMKLFSWDLVDEVYDCGNYLLVRNRGEEEKVMLANIMNISASTNSRLPRVTLRLAAPGKFDSEIAFLSITPFTLNPFAKDQVAEDLMARVYKARSKPASR